MKITRRNAVLFLLWAVFVLSLPIYVFWTIFNYHHLCAWEAKFCGFLDRLIIKKTMETTKEEMMRLLRELQELQMWLSDSFQEMSLNVDFNIFEDRIMINCYTCLFSNFDKKGKSVWLYSYESYEENRKQLNYFVKYVKKLSKYGSKKSETNQTPTGKSRV